jgi:nuclear transport factor 2 (NTF2) superfamily protein
MQRREASINDVAIEERERRFVAATWAADELPLR